MIPLTVRNLHIGGGTPKICVPLMGTSLAELEEEAGEVLRFPADMVEWRADQFEEVFAEDGTLRDAIAASGIIANAGKMLRGLLKDMPILFTLRTVPEGGKARLSRSEYERMITVAASAGFADMADVELFTGKENFTGMVNALHGMNILAVGSSHDFEKTPARGEILNRLERMREGGADVCKIAVMPQCMEDVVTLLSASLEMKAQHPDTPLIALSMGKEGIVSRIAGGYFGSDITFASAGKPSAPGQINVKDCKYIMDIIHKEQIS